MTTFATRTRPSSPGVTLALVLLGFLVLPMLMSGTTVALPRIGLDLNTSGTALQWVVTGYFLTASSCMLVAGSLADSFGRRRVFRTGNAIYIAGTIATAAATDIVLLNAARTLSGVGAAGVLASGGAILATTFHGPARTRAFAAMGTGAGVGLAIGPSLSGWLVGEFGWRTTFVFFAAVGVLILAGTAFVTESRAAERSRLDWPGAATFIGGLALVMFGIAQGPQAGWGSPRVLALFAVGAALLVSFALVERRSAHPVLDLTLIRNKGFMGWNLAGLAIAVGFGGLLGFLPTYLQGVNEISTKEAGLIMLMLTAPVLLAPPVGGWLVNRGVPARGLVTLALFLLAGGNAWLTTIHPGVRAVELLGPLLTIGIGMGVTIGIMDGRAMNLVEPDRVGMAAGFLNTVRGGANTLVLAVFGSALIGLLHTRLGSAGLANRVAAGDLAGPDRALLAAEFTGAWQVALWCVAGSGAVLAIAVNRLLARPRPRSPGPSGSAAPAIG
ncbi:MAG: MFS transporter [Pseudonocardiaceae bacterium]|nr:MFS transporter [Pseudonocardiaceae bacterium]